MLNVSAIPRPALSPAAKFPEFSQCAKLEGIALSRLIMQAVASAYGISQSELHASTRRCAAVSFARQVAMYLTHVTCGYTLTEVGILFHRDRTTAAYACRKIEDSRDDPDLDFCLDCLESAVRGWAFHQNPHGVSNDRN